MVILRNSLLSKVNPGLLGEEIAESAIPNLSDEEMIVAESEIAEAESQSMELQQELEALEDMENIQTALAEQVAQNDVNLAAVQGEEVPEEGSVTEIVGQQANEEGTVEDVSVAEVETPAPELSQDSTPEAIIEKTMEVEGAMEAISGIMTGARLHSKDGLYAKLGIRRSGFGMESAMKDPLMTYKFACEGIKEALGATFGRFGAAISNLYNKFSRFVKKIMNVLPMYVAKLRNTLTYARKLNPNDYVVKEGKGVSQDVLLFTFNNGKGAIQGRIDAIDNVLTTFSQFQKKVTDITIKENPYSQNFKKEVLSRGLAKLPEGETLEDVILIPRTGRSILCVNKKTYKTSSIKLAKASNVVENLTGPERAAMAKEIATEAVGAYKKAERVLIYTENGIKTFSGLVSVSTINGLSAKRVTVDENGKEKVTSDKWVNNRKISNIISSYLNISGVLLDIYKQAVSAYKSLLGSIKKADNSKSPDSEQDLKAAEEAVNVKG